VRFTAPVSHQQVGPQRNPAIAIEFSVAAMNADLIEAEPPQRAARQVFRKTRLVSLQQTCAVAA
jgi:hypothetical protein